MLILILIFFILIYLIYRNCKKIFNFFVKNQHKLLFFFSILSFFQLINLFLTKILNLNFKKKKKTIFTNLKIQSKIKADDEIKNDFDKDNKFIENNNYNYNEQDYIIENYPFYFENENIENQKGFAVLVKKINFLDLNSKNYLKKGTEKELQIIANQFEKNYTKKQMFDRLFRNFKFINNVILTIIILSEENDFDFQNYLKKIQVFEPFLVQFPINFENVNDIDQFDYFKLFFLYCQIAKISGYYHDLFLEKKKNV